MVLRPLTIKDLPEASMMMRFVYDNCSRDGSTTEMNEFFEEYASIPNLEHLMSEGRLLLWGIYETLQIRREDHLEVRDCLLAAGGMTPEGQVTLLYVLPRYQNRKYATLLLEEMRRFAGTQIGLERVWCNVFPARISPFFKRKGFDWIQGAVPEGGSFVPMDAKTIYLKNYRRKPFPKWAIALLAAGSVLVAFLCGIGYMFLA